MDKNMNWTKAELTSPRLTHAMDVVSDFCERVMQTTRYPPAEIDDVMDMCIRYRQAQSDLAYKAQKKTKGKLQ